MNRFGCFLVKSLDTSIAQGATTGRSCFGRLVVDGSRCLSSTGASSGREDTTAPRRSRRSRRRKLDLNGSTGSSGMVPSYKEFVHRITVLHMYRDFLKSVRHLPASQASELTSEIKIGFQSLKSETDAYSIQRAMAEGKRKLAELDSLLPPSKQKFADPGSWINIDDEDDKRGRVGTGWPWEN